MQKTDSGNGGAMQAERDAYDARLAAQATQARERAQRIMAGHQTMTLGDVAKAIRPLPQGAPAGPRVVKKPRRGWPFFD